MNDRDQILVHVLGILRDWDPIGVGQSAADDEYRRYAIKIVRKLDQGCDFFKMVKWLRGVRTIGMGLPADDDHDQLIAGKLLEIEK